LPVEKKGHYIRERIRSPKAFKTLRTQIVGKHRRIAGRLKSTGQWATQAILHPLKEEIKRIKKGHAARVKRFKKYETKHKKLHHTRFCR
jgi:hypothetical protein